MQALARVQVAERFADEVVAPARGLAAEIDGTPLVEKYPVLEYVLG